MMRLALFFVLGLSAAVRAQEAEPISWSYDSELGLHVWGGAAMLELADIRDRLREENALMEASSWNGSLDLGNLEVGVLGGFQVCYGLARDLKVVGAVEGRGVAVRGIFEGYGPNSATDPILGFVPQEIERVSAFSAWGGEAGLLYFLRYVGDFSRLGLLVKAGPHSLAGSSDRADETGLLRSGSAKTKYSASAAGFYAGLFWEWMSPPPSSSLPFSGFMSAGYRFLRFSRVKYSYTDSNGGYSAGTLRDSSGRDLRVDFSGPEIALGLSLLFQIQPPR